MAVTESIKASLASLLAQELDKAREEIIQEAAQKFTQRARQVVGRAAVQVADFYSVERVGPELLIRVKLDCS